MNLFWQLSSQIPSADVALITAGPHIKAVTNYKQVRGGVKIKRGCYCETFFSSFWNYLWDNSLQSMSWVIHQTMTTNVAYRVFSPPSNCVGFQNTWGIWSWGATVQRFGGEISQPYCHPLCCQVTQHPITCKYLLCRKKNNIVFHNQCLHSLYDINDVGFYESKFGCLVVSSLQLSATH